MSIARFPKNPDEYARIEDDARCASIKKVKEVIEWVLSIHGDDVNCFVFHCELKRHFPLATCWHMTEGHILTEIDGFFWDKTGLRLHRFADAARFTRAFDWDKS